MRILYESLAIGGLLLTGAALHFADPGDANPASPSGVQTAATNATSPVVVAALTPDGDWTWSLERPGIADAVYAESSQFTARFDQTNNTWKLLPQAGDPVTIEVGRCATGTMAPQGVWLVTQDAEGQPELVATSATRLPAGSPDRFAMRDCGEANGRQLAVPRTVIDLLAANTGAIYVDN